MQNPDVASLMLFAHLCRLKPDAKVLADISAEINRKAKEEASARHLVKAQLQPWCEASVDRINLLLPLAITIMYNQKGRYQVGILSTSDHQKGERFVSNPSDWIHPAGMTAEDRKELAQLYKQYRAAHVFVQAVSSHSGDAAAPIAGLRIPKCQLSDMPDTLVHMTEYRHVRSIQQYGLLPGGGNTAGNKQRNMNHFLPIDGLLVSYEHIRPTALMWRSFCLSQRWNSIQSSWKILA